MNIEHEKQLFRKAFKGLYQKGFKWNEIKRFQMEMLKDVITYEVEKMTEKGVSDKEIIQKTGCVSSYVGKISTDYWENKFNHLKI